MQSEDEQKEEQLFDKDQPEYLGYFHGNSIESIEAAFQPFDEERVSFDNSLVI